MMDISNTTSQDCCFVNPSYFFFADSEENGRNGSFYFTYFTQYENSTNGSEYYEAGFFIANCILSCVFNSLIFLSMTHSELRTSCNVFIFNMAVADMIYGLIGPAMAVVRLNGDWNLGPLMCHLVFYLQSVCGCVVSWSIAVVSIDRYIHIVHPLKIHLAISAQQAVLIVAVIWLLSVSFMLPVGIFFKVIERPNPSSPDQIAHICTLFWPKDIWYTCSIISTTVASCFVFIFPITLMSWCYTRCAREMHSISKSVTRRMDSVGSHSSVLDMKRRRSLREYRVIRTFMILLLVYVLAWGPFFSILPVIIVDLYNKTTVMKSKAFVWALAVAQFNAVVNPLVYGLGIRNVRSGLLRRFKNYVH